MNSSTDEVSGVPKRRKVALLIDTSRETGRGVLQGVIRYIKERNPWLTYFQPHGIEEMPPRWLASWKGDGIVARINSQRAAKLLRRTGLPVIDLRAAIVVPEFSRLEVDNEATADMVVSHLADCGIRRFGFCGYPRGTHRLYDERCEMFVRRVQKGGWTCSVLRLLSRTRSAMDWESDLQRIENWINSLQEHVGIMACNDDLGLMVLDACRRAGRRVPDEIAVVGVENDPFLCNLCLPPLTSVDVNPERLGFDACVLLERKMQGKAIAACTRKPPSQLVKRQSTDILAIDDPIIVEAIRYIRQHACLGMTVGELIDRIPLSRSLLNRRFQETLGRSPKQEITRVRIERARELLVNSEMSIHDISTSCGFDDANYFSKWFHEQQGSSPRRFRHNSGNGSRGFRR